MSAVLFLMGPTAAGKTAAAVELVEEFPFEIVSVDSALVYRGLDIGTAKPDQHTLTRAPHRLIDIVDPAEAYSAGQFIRDARAATAAIRSAQKVPFLVGGTLLYFRAYATGLADLPQASPQIRAQIEVQAAAEGWPALHTVLSGLDAATAARIHPNDSQRIQRALEVYRVTGRPLSELQRDARPAPCQETIYRVAWCPSRRIIYENCKKRLNSMIEKGFLLELERLYSRGDLTPGHPAIRAVGYRQFWEYLEGRCSLEAASRNALVATRRLAKRQLTWLRGEPGVVWIDPQRPGARQRLRRTARRVVRAALG
ncbi:MAG: tRNA (adenosine(37)-N6)-dimethylallyltransferase MiaA [Gammaproteobacteria bacterium]|nr:tRNA (adenosine(37)-N6)-dimethylallyltransferase MiaA [Gammaproteobacteria bacterium]